MASSAERVTSVILPTGLLMSFFSPWTSGLISWLQVQSIGTYVKFPADYNVTALGVLTTLVIWGVGRLEQRNINIEKAKLAEQELQ
jgi:hypothetical protein